MDYRRMLNAFCMYTIFRYYCPYIIMYYNIEIFGDFGASLFVIHPFYARILRY